MRIATITKGSETAAIVIDSSDDYLFADELFPGGEYKDCLDVIKNLSPTQITQSFLTSSLQKRKLVDVEFHAPYRQPEMIWGIGLNYLDHASDLSAVAPGDEPASFIKGNHTIIGPGEEIRIPIQSKRTTAEAELGIVIAKDCRNVSEKDAINYVFGVVPILDQTAEDILQKNPRFLTRSKNFDTFFSFGPWIMVLDEVLEKNSSIGEMTVSTIHNGNVHRSNQVINMTFGPENLISFHSAVFTLQPGDIISTGTPGAVHITEGDIVGCDISGVGSLQNSVINAKEGS
jgi:2-keto-4-pentenoate hydratase/2-oxohepta-3-ene-1,7-dioic acid hydratase in catechol pathway